MAERIARWLFIGLPAAMLALLLLRPIFDVDIFWQIKLGDMMLDRGGLVATEPFSASHLGEPLAQLSALGQIILAEVRRIGGWQALQVFDALVWLGGIVAASLAVRRTMSEPAGIVAALLLAFSFGISFSSVRPQSFAALGFGLLIALLISQRSWPIKLLLGAVLLVIWQNLHPSVAIAMLYVGARAGWGWLGVVLGRRTSLPVFETALALLAGLAMFATPAGIGILAISARNAAASTAMGVDEWEAAWSASNLALMPILAPFPLIVFALLFLHRDKLDWRWLFPCLVLFVATLFVARFGLFWAISTIPVIAALLTPQTEPDHLAVRDNAYSLLTLGIAAVVALTTHQVRFAEWLPVQGVAALKAQQVRGTIVAELPWGGPLIDAGYPNWQVALDGRYYVYTDAELTFARTFGASPTALMQIERTWAPSALLLDPQVSEVLIQQLRQNPKIWREIRTGDFSAAFVRIKPPTAAPAAP